MKDFFCNLVTKLIWLVVFIFMVGPMDIILAYFGINFFISTIIAFVYYILFKDIPFLKTIVFIASCIVVFIGFPLKIFIGYIFFFIILGLLIYSPWIIGIISIALHKNNED